jgi:hypothetical protein
MAVAAAAGCGSDRDTLLQLDVAIPAAASPTRLDVQVGLDGASQVRRSYAGALPAGATLGVDLYLPRSLAGTQPVLVAALDGGGCLVAQQTLSILITPGARIQGGLVSLVAPATRVCRPDGGADAGAIDADGGGRPDSGASADAHADAGADVVDAAAPADAAGATPDAAPSPDMPAPDVLPPPRPCSDVSGCGADENCFAGTCQEAAADCADVARRAPGAPDGIYRLRVGARVEAAYCDMRLQRVLCAATAGQHAGRTRDGANVPFLLSSVLEGDVCRIWAVRHQTGGHPFDMLLDTSTCQALGFKADADIRKQCYYGSTAHCGFTVQVVSGPNGRYVAKWGNSCDCNPNRGKPFYSFEDGVQVSMIPWNFDGSLSGRCRVR